MFDEYYYHKLDSSGQSVYRTIKKSLSMGRYSVYLPSYSQHTIEDAVLAINYDHPEFYSINSEEMRLSSSIVGSTITFASLLSPVEQKKADLNYTQYKESLHSMFSPQTQDYKKIVAIHQFLIPRIQYDLLESRPALSGGIAGPLLYGKGKCSGISKLFKTLCDEFDLPCIIVAGTADEPNGFSGNHMWNIVRVGERWGHIDMTWDITMGNGKKYYDYLLLTDQEIGNNHYWERGKTPICNDPSINFHALIHCDYRNINDAMSGILNDIMANKKGIVGRINTACSEDLFSRELHKVLQKARINGVSYHFNPMFNTFRIEIKNAL